LYEAGETEKLVDASLNGDFNVKEAIRFFKIALPLHAGLSSAMTLNVHCASNAYRRKGCE